MAKRAKYNKSEEIRGKREIDIKVIEGREMNDYEVETVASLIFHWWRKEYELERSPETGIDGTGNSMSKPNRNNN